MDVAVAINKRTCGYMDARRRWLLPRYLFICEAVSRRTDATGGHRSPRSGDDYIRSPSQQSVFLLLLLGFKRKYFIQRIFPLKGHLRTRGAHSTVRAAAGRKELKAALSPRRNNASTDSCVETAGDISESFGDLAQTCDFCLTPFFLNIFF